ncbi:hypothetical protein [Pontimicrobium sp. IMCC45349]|jgi:hypothetical protein|uniref:hypothetical protein n=1 Tax=Pontimicrobium sp. IMCC45349 TaxID=3391574 RepID=UPI0039A20340
MNDKISLLACALLTIGFVVSGLLDILDNLVVRALLFAGYFIIVFNIIIVKSKDEDKKNLPD